MDIFRVNSLIAFSLRWLDPRTVEINRFRQLKEPPLARLKNES